MHIYEFVLGLLGSSRLVFSGSTVGGSVKLIARHMASREGLWRRLN